MRRLWPFHRWAGLVGLLIVGSIATACAPEWDDTLRVAVAANFTEPAREIADRFTAATGHRADLSFGSTGQLYAQIRQEAPFEVFLAADEETPERLVSEGFAVGTRVVTYAVGDIVLYGPTLDVTDGDRILRSGAFDRIAMANPAIAPYGRAAREAIEAMGLSAALGPKIVEGQNISQAFQFVETGNAELGFVARSQVVDRPSKSVWAVPRSLYSPIRQDAVLLTRGLGNDAAEDFMTFLESSDAVAIIEGFGYRLPR